MNLELKNIDVGCPSCGAAFSTTVDPSGGSRTYVEDCPICCNPIEFRVHVELDEWISVETAREDE